MAQNENRQTDHLQKLLGYLNFSEGRPDPQFQRNMADLHEAIVAEGVTEPWREIHTQLRAHLSELQDSGSAAFRDATQAERVLTFVFESVLPAYQSHHSDLLFHLSSADLFQPYFIVRVVEAVLSRGPLRADSDKLADEVLKQLNDYVGHRPIAVLESRPKGEPYDKERFRPIPIYIRGAGPAPGPYKQLIEKTLAILAGTKKTILADAFFDLEQLEELALDPRAYDHGHPANRRPNYVFGEWDPHLIDNKGRYRRFVVRQLILDAACERIATADMPPEYLLYEAAAVLAGTILMASGISGNGPDAHDSSVTLSNLIPRIAAYRDAFYAGLLDNLDERHAAALRQEMERLQQPFGGARQHLNQYLSRHRAAQLQQRHLALVMAELGYPEAGRKQAAKFPAASTNFVSELYVRLATGQATLNDGQLKLAAQQLVDIEDMVQRGIACGALADPWNILGYAGLFPLFQAMEDSIRDPRIDELVSILEQTFNLYSRLLAEAAAAGEDALGNRMAANMHNLANWWDRFATYEISDVRPVHGGEAAISAEQVATAIRLWRERGETAADLAFWREHLEGFQSPKAYSLIIQALLEKEDYRASMGLMMHWLSQLDLVPLEDGEYSFHPLALQWMLGFCQESKQQSSGQSGEQAVKKTNQPPEMVVKFFDYLEANADDYWSAPRLEILGIPLEELDEQELLEMEEEQEDDDEEIFEAAYEGMVFQDSADDDVDMDVLEIGPELEFDLELEGERIENHLKFLSTVARLWNIAARLTCTPGGERTTAADNDILGTWLAQARQNYKSLLALLDNIYDYPIASDSVNYDSAVEFDRRRVIKERLLHVIIGTCLETWLAGAALRSRRGQPRKRASWKAELVLLEEALWKGDAAAARDLVPGFLDAFKSEPMLFTPLSSEGHPRQILSASRAQTILRALAANLPRLGLLNEAFLVVQTAHEMERRQQLPGPRITEFARLFQIGCQASVEAVVDAVENAPDVLPDDQLLLKLARSVFPYLPLWREHSRTLRLSSLEIVAAESEWAELRGFIQRYGRDLFHVRFMTFGNLRGILHQGVGEYLDYLSENADPMHPIRLVEDLDRGVPRAVATRRLEMILQAVIENYDVYKDYNSTAAQSDYGDNLYILLDFLRIKADYDRQAWYFRPLVHVHEVLARRLPSAAAAWQEQFTRAAAPLAERYLQQLAQLERKHGTRLNTVRDRLEGRFVKPLSLDRLCALIEPAMTAAGGPQAEQALKTFEEHLRPCADNPSGVGLDVPQWLQRVEATIQQVKMSASEIAEMAENLLQIPKQPLAMTELEQQLVQPTEDPSWRDLWNAIISSLGRIGGK